MEGNTDAPGKAKENQQTAHSVARVAHVAPENGARAVRSEEHDERAAIVADGSGCPGEWAQALARLDPAQPPPGMLIKLEHVEYATVAELVNAAIGYSTARDEPWPEAQARADEIVSAHDAYMAEWKSPDDASEAVAEIEKEIEGYYDEVHPVAEAIVATRAVTLDGLIVKARAVRWIYRDDPEQFEAEANGTDDELLRSITADLWAMQTDPAA